MSTLEMTADVAANGTEATVSVAGKPTETVQYAREDQLRSGIIQRATEIAREHGTIVRLTSKQSNGVFSLLVSGDGRISPDNRAEPQEHTAPVEPLRRTRPMTVEREIQAPTVPEAEQPQEIVEEAPEEGRRSFLADDSAALPPATGWRGLVTRTTGIKIAPSLAEQERLMNIRAVSQHWAGSRSISVVNGKGGVGKTLTTAMLSAVFARHGGSGVIAWDNNDTRGTLGWRTERSSHNATIQDLGGVTEQLMQPTATIGDLALYVHHQSADMYDVLRSNPKLLASDQRLTAAEFDALNEVIKKYSRMVIFDTGNDESSERWLRMIDHSDQLVVPTSPSGEAAESAALLLEELSQRDERSAKLVKNAVVVVTVAERSTPAAEVARIVSGFEKVAPRTVVIPFDPSLKSGALRFDSLKPATKNAWIAAGAAVAASLNEQNA